MSDKRERKFKYRQCTRKVRYSEQMARGRARTQNLAAYKCSFCADWHVTTTKEGKEAKAMMLEMEKNSEEARRRRRMGR
jgi:hypothetical protein